MRIVCKKKKFVRKSKVRKKLKFFRKLVSQLEIGLAEKNRNIKQQSLDMQLRIDKLQLNLNDKIDLIKELQIKIQHLNNTTKAIKEESDYIKDLFLKDNDRFDKLLSLFDKEDEKKEKLRSEIDILNNRIKYEFKGD
jgi:hypothetical protein